MMASVDQRYFPSDPVAQGQWAEHERQRSAFWDRVQADRDKADAMMQVAYDYSGMWGVPKKNQFLPGDQVIIDKTPKEAFGMNVQGWQDYAQVRRADGSAYSDREGTSWDVTMDPEAHDLDALASKSLGPRNGWVSRPQTLISPYRQASIVAREPPGTLWNQSLSHPGPNRPNLIRSLAEDHQSRPEFLDRLGPRQRLQNQTRPEIPAPLLLGTILVCFAFLIVRP